MLRVRRGGRSNGLSPRLATLVATELSGLDQGRLSGPSRVLRLGGLKFLALGIKLRLQNGADK